MIAALRRLGRFDLAAVAIGVALLAGAAGLARSRGAQLVVAVALLAALGGCGARLATLLRPDARGAARATCAGLLAWALATTLATALGHFGALRPAWFLLAALAAWAALRRVPAPVGRGPDALLRLARRRPTVLRLVAGAAVATVAATTLEILRHGRRLAPGHLSFDDLSYHLSNVALWHQTGDLRTFKFGFGDPATAFYPLGGELAAWTLLAPFGDSDFLARWAQVPFAVLSLFAVASIARRLGLSRAGAAVAALLAWTSPRVFPELALTAGNDHSAAFATLATLEGALALRAAAGAGAAVYLGAAVGALVGTKYLGLVLAALPLVVAALALGERTRRAPRLLRRPWRTALILAAAVATAVLVGGYAYARNAAGTGNPIFPSPVTIAGRPLLAGWETSSLAARRRGGEAQIAALAFLWQRGDLMGPLARWLLVPASLIAPVVALARRRRASTVLVLLAPAVGYLQFLYLTHDHRDLRYFLAGFELAGVATAFLVGSLPRPWRRPAQGAALLAVTATLLLQRPFELGAWRPALAVAALLAVLALVARRPWPPRPRWAAAAAAALVVAVALPRAGRAVESYERTRTLHGPVARVLEELVGPQGTAVAYVGWNQPYLAFGDRLQNRLHLVPTDGPPELEHWDWGRSPRLAWSPSCCFRRWWRNLRELGVTHVVVVTLDDPNPERHWMERRPERFTRLATARDGEVWRVLRRQGDATADD